MREELDTYNFVSNFSINDSDAYSTNEIAEVDNDNCPNLSIHQKKIPLLNTLISDVEDNNLELEYHNFEDNNNYFIDNIQLHNESDSSSSSSNNNASHNFMTNYSKNSEIAQWALLNKIPHTAINSLLHLLKKINVFHINQKMLGHLYILSQLKYQVFKMYSPENTIILVLNLVCYVIYNMKILYKPRLKLI